MKNEKLYGLDGDEILHDSIGDLIDGHDLVDCVGETITVIEYVRSATSSQRCVESAFECLLESLAEEFGNYDDGELINGHELEFGKFIEEITEHIDSTLINWNCQQTGKTIKYTIPEVK